MTLPVPLLFLHTGDNMTYCVETVFALHCCVVILPIILCTDSSSLCPWTPDVVVVVHSLYTFKIRSPVEK